jgi:hypothetical protein
MSVSRCTYWEFDNNDKLHLSGENINQSQRVFSGTLSYLFNISLPKIFRLAKYWREELIVGSPNQTRVDCRTMWEKYWFWLESWFVNEFSLNRNSNYRTPMKSATDFLTKVKNLTPIYDKTKKEPKPNYMLLNGD